MKAHALCVAAIDVGSNAIRMLILQVDACGMERRRLLRRYPVSLGSDVFASGRIGAVKRAALLAAFGDVASRLRRSGVQAYRAVATSAMREAKNGAALVREVRRRTGLRLEIISGAEEGQLARAALLQYCGAVAPRTLLLDLGGGSLEIDRVGAAPGSGRSLPVGSVRLLRRLPALGERLHGTAFLRARQQVREMLATEVGQAWDAGTALGTGGNLDALVRLLPTSRPGTLPALAVSHLLALVRRAAALPPRARARAFALRPDRATVLVPAALIILELCHLFKVRRLWVPGTGLRDALAMQQLTAIGGSPPSPLAALLPPAAARQATRTVHVAQRLLAGLFVLHRRHAPAQQPLQAAALAWHLGALLQPARAAVLGAALLRARPDPMLTPAARRLALQVLAGLDDDAAELAPSAALLAGLLRLAIALSAQGVEPQGLDVDLLASPIVVRAALRRPLPAALTAPLSRALGRRLQVQ